jgi:glyceraldehyde-3-phosphate dehydrogenase/erythrose-4-phosphate dehydrogenase
MTHQHDSRRASGLDGHHPGTVLVDCRRRAHVVDDTQVKVVAWYDNEWGYSNRLVELAQRVLVPLGVAA